MSRRGAVYHPVQAIAALAFVGCATAVGVAINRPTLYVTNNSGGSVQLFVEDGGSRRSLGRVVGPSGCLRIPRTSVGARVGLRHIASRTVTWSGRLDLASRPGWVIEVGQPRGERFDLLGLQPGPRCS